MTTTELSSISDGAQVIVNTAVRTVPPTELEPGKIYAFHTANGVEHYDLTGDEYRDQPLHKAGLTSVHDATSFLAYYGKHSDEASEVYADPEVLTITAVLDAHEPTAARRGGHRLQLQLRQTQAWREWIARDGQLLSQQDFAEFIEDHLPDLLEPAAAQMLEIAQSIQGATKADFQSGTRLSSGERQFKYVETISAKAGQKGELTVPETFVVGLVPCEGSEGYKLTARLRYRIGTSGTLQMGYRLERPADVLRTAFGDVCKAVSEQIAIPIMNGTPAPGRDIPPARYAWHGAR